MKRIKKRAVKLSLLAIIFTALILGGVGVFGINSSNASIQSANAQINTTTPLITTPFGDRPITSLAIDHQNVYLGAWWGGTGTHTFAVFNKSTQNFTHIVAPNFAGGIRNIQTIVQDQTHVYIGGGTNFARWCKTTHSMSSLIPTGLGGSIHRLAICDNYVYIISQTYNRMGIFSKDAGVVSRHVIFNIAAGWRDIALNDTYVFIGGANSFVRFNKRTQVMSQPKNLPSGSNVQSMIACDQFLYIGSSGNLIIYNISTGVFETIWTGIDDIGVISAIEMNDNFVYLGGQGYVAVFNKVTRIMTQAPPINFAGNIGTINSMAAFGTSIFFAGWQGNFSRGVVDPVLYQAVNYVTVSFLSRDGELVSYVRIARDSILAVNQVPGAPMVAGFEFLYWTNLSGVRVNSLIFEDTILWAHYRAIGVGGETSEDEDSEGRSVSMFLIVLASFGGGAVVILLVFLIVKVVSKFKKKDGESVGLDDYDFDIDEYLDNV